MPRLRIRAPLLLLAMGALLAALWGGLSRLGWPLPAAAVLAQTHGPLMAVGFLGTLITLERAVATARPWAYGAAAAMGLGALALVLASPTALGPALMAVGALGLVGVFIVVLRRQTSLVTVTMAAGAALLFLGNLLWALGWPIPEIVPFWGGFLLLTIAGERLELSRVAAFGRGAARVFAGLVVLYLAGIVSEAIAPTVCPALAQGPLARLHEGLFRAATLAPVWGPRIAGIAILGLVAWLVRYDVARRTIRGRGLPRFAAACMLTGYVWLAVHGLLSMVMNAQVAGLGYDARWHSLFLGFVFAMIFGHAPIILPAVLGRPLPFRARFYAPLALMQVGLVLRMLGDLAAWPDTRAWGGLIDALAIMLFLLNTALGLLESRIQVPEAQSLT